MCEILLILLCDVGVYWAIFCLVSVCVFDVWLFFRSSQFWLSLWQLAVNMRCSSTSESNPMVRFDANLHKHFSYLSSEIWFSDLKLFQLVWPISNGFLAPNLLALLFYGASLYDNLLRSLQMPRRDWNYWKKVDAVRLKNKCNISLCL